MDLAHTIRPDAFSETFGGKNIFSSYIKLNIRLEGSFLPGTQRILYLPYRFQDFTLHGKLFLIGDIRNQITVSFQELRYNFRIEGYRIYVQNVSDELVKNGLCTLYICSLPLCPRHVSPTKTDEPFRNLGSEPHVSLIPWETVKFFRLSSSRLLIRTHLKNLVWTPVSDKELHSSSQQYTYSCYISLNAFYDNYSFILYHTIRNILSEDKGSTPAPREYF